MEARVTAAEGWNPAALIAFRFAFVYWLLYCWPGEGRVSVLDAIPLLPPAVVTWLEAPWHALCPWVAVHVFGLSGPVTQYHPTGSGDTTLDYVQLFCMVVIACAATVVWSVLDRRRTNYTTLYPWLRLVVRFTLAFTLLSYGFSKIFPLQFGGSVPLSTLVQSYGESSPMHLLWTFMAASTAYTAFGGFAEAAAGTLLLFRRTAVLGALAACGVLLNVAVLNYAYDVPVKLYSTHLFFMGAFLLLPELSALWAFFVRHVPARLSTVWLPPSERHWLRVTGIVLQALIIVSVFASNIWGGYSAMAGIGKYLERPPVYGVWDAERGPWRRMVFSTTGYMVAVGTDGKRTGYRTTYDLPGRAFQVTSFRYGFSADLTYVVRDPQHLELRGTMNGKPVEIAAHRIDTAAFLLTTRGFHWINEDPYNR